MAVKIYNFDEKFSNFYNEALKIRDDAFIETDVYGKSMIVRGNSVFNSDDEFRDICVDIFINTKVDDSFDKDALEYAEEVVYRRCAKVMVKRIISAMNAHDVRPMFPN